MAIPIKMPQLGESVVEGTISRWLKSPGEDVTEYEPLLEVASDKVDTEITAPTAGKLDRILVRAGETVKVGTILAYLAEQQAESDGKHTLSYEPETEAAGAGPPAQAVAAQPETRPRRSEVSPAVSRIAREQGISLRELLAINGSGEGGRVTKRDLERYLKTRRAVIPSPGPAESVGFPAESPPAPAPSAPSPAPALSTLSKPATEPVTTGWSTPDEVTLGQTLPMTPMRAAIAEHMVRSKQTSPHVTSIAEVDMSRVIAYRQANREVFARQGVNLTYTAFFVQAAVEALRRYPLANASLVDNKIVIHPRVNVGVAVALENGLIVPVVKRAENLSLKGLAAAINDLATRARQKKLSHDDVRDGTFTVTNPGMQGVLFGTAIINQPQAAILGVGAIAERVIALNGAIAIRPMVYLSLTYDHRIMDGAGANFVIVAIRDFLQNYPLV